MHEVGSRFLATKKRGLETVYVFFWGGEHEGAGRTFAKVLPAPSYQSNLTPLT